MNGSSHSEIYHMSGYENCLVDHKTLRNRIWASRTPKTYLCMNGWFMSVKG